MSIMKRNCCDGNGCTMTSGGDLGMTMSVGNIRWIGLSRDYDDLKHKPTINGRVLQGDMHINDIGGLTEEQIIKLVDKVNKATGVSYFTEENIRDMTSEYLSLNGYVTGDQALNIIVETVPNLIQQYFDEHPELIVTDTEFEEKFAERYAEKEVGNVKWGGDANEDGKMNLDELSVVGEGGGIEPMRDAATQDDIDRILGILNG